MQSIPEEELNILTLIRITQDYCSDPKDAFEHILDMAAKAIRELPVEADKIEEDYMSEMRPTIRQGVSECVEILMRIRDEMEEAGRASI